MSAQALGLRRRAVVAVIGALVLLAGCGGPAPDATPQFVGRWQSTRSTLPIHLLANGEWEIRSDGGPAQQYGLWRYAQGRLVWTFKNPDGRLTQEANPVLSVSANEFRLSEQDRSVTVFTRLP